LSALYYAFLKGHGRMSVDSAVRPPPAGRRLAIIVSILLLLALLAVLGWMLWQRVLSESQRGPREAELAALQLREKSLTQEIASIKPREMPMCRPGEALREITAKPGPVSAAPGATGKPIAPPAAEATGEPVPALSKEALLERLERATALVVVTGGKGLGLGSGFFVTENLLITNRHVIEGAPEGRVYLVSRRLASVRRATVVRATRSSDVGLPDFALVRMDTGSAPGTLEVGPQIAKLAYVAAAGYPGLVVEKDPSFERLIRGDMSAAPDLNLTQGSVQSLQNSSAGVPLVLHTAEIARGNSGGPLVDACGRVVGVNTFIGVDATQSAKSQYAISGRVVNAFAQATGAPLRTDLRPCKA